MNEVPPGKPVRHHLHRPHQRSRLPIAFGAETVAVRHQPLHREARQLRQAVEVFERVGEGFEPALVQERPQSDLDLRRIAERLVPRATFPQLGRERRTSSS